MGQRQARLKGREDFRDPGRSAPQQKETLRIYFGGSSALVEKQMFAEEISGRSRSRKLSSRFEFHFVMNYKQVMFTYVNCIFKGIDQLHGKIDGIFLLYKDNQTFDWAKNLYEDLPGHMGSSKMPVVVLVYIHEDKNQENYKIYNFGANRTAEEDNEHLKLKDPLLEQGMEWAEKMGDVSFMEWGGGKKADRTHLERMRRAIMLDEAFYEKGITIKRAR